MSVARRDTAWLIAAHSHFWPALQVDPAQAVHIRNGADCPEFVGPGPPLIRMTGVVEIAPGMTEHGR